MSRPLKVLIIGDGDAGKTSLRSRYLSNQFKPAYRATIGADFVSKTIEVSVPVPRESKRRKRRLSKASSSSSSCHSSCDENEEGNTHQKDDSKSSVVKGKNKAEQQKDGKTSRPHPKRSCSSELAAATAARHQEKVRVTLSIWDTAGQERFRSLGTAFYRGADAVIIAFDITKKGSLARTLQWYRDFCAMGDLGDEVELGLTPKQIRLAKQQKERFCWVAVGCKGDLLTKLNEQKDKQNVQGISWQSARNWFDEMQPRYLPITQSETNAFADVDPASHAVRKARPYAIHDEIPADPEDVLSRPSPKNQPSFSLSNESTNKSIDARHPQAGTPPGEAIAPGQDANLREQPTLEAHGRLNNQGLNSIELWEGGLSTSNSSSNGGGQDEGVVTNNGYERSRYDSTTSQSGNSVYYSVRGSTIVSQSPTIRTSDSPNRLANGTLPSTVRSNGVNGISQPRAESPSSHFSGKDISNRSRKQSNLSSLNTSSEDDETETEPRNTSRPPLDKSESEQSVLTERGVTSKESEGNGTNKEDEEEKGGENATIAISSIPSGDPIPFPTEDEVKDENDLQEIRARRRKRLSRLSQKRQSIASLSAVEANEALIIAETTKEQREEEEQEIHEVEEEEEEHIKRQAKRTNENHLDNRMTLYSARPSSTTSTIRPADGDISQDDENSNTKLHPPKNGQNERTANSSLVVLDVESDDDESDADSNLYEDHIEQGFRLFYTSAKNGTSIDDVFQHIAYRVALRWTYEEWEEAQRRQAWGYGPEGEVRTAPPTNEEIEIERVKRAIKISQGKGTGGCCSG